MAHTEQFIEDQIDPIDIVETIADSHDWEFDRIGDDQIAMSVEGQWRNYSITLAWTGFDETLRLISTFEIDPPSDTLPALYETINMVNDQCWGGGFTYWNETKLMVFRYGLMLSGGQIATAEQIKSMIATAVHTAERFYPAFQLIAWGGRTPKDALEVAIAEAYGHA